MKTHQNIPIDSIDKPLFPSRFGRDDSSLKNSIQKYDVLVPPYVLDWDGEYHVIDGWARIQICRQLKIESINCIIIERSDPLHESLFNLCLELNIWSRKFNIIEQAKLLEIAKKIYKADEMPRTVCEKLDVNPDRFNHKQYFQILSLPDAVQKFAVDHQLKISVLLDFLGFSQEDANHLVLKLQNLPINQNRFSEILQLIKDIATRDSISITKIIDDAFSEIGFESQPQIALQKLRDILFAQRNPQYQMRLQGFRKTVKKLIKNNKTKIEPAPYFEDDYIEVKTRVSNQDELEDFIKSLDNDSWRDLFLDAAKR